MKILVRLPNWLGDMVMSVAFIYELQRQYPGAAISVIAKKGIHDLLSFFPSTKHQFIFSKDEYKGLPGLMRFGRMIRKTESFDLFFCLPDSFSSALMGYATGAKKRIGFKNEFRGLLMTHTYQRPKGLHRVTQYVSLIQFFSKQKLGDPMVLLQHGVERKNSIVVNINSEASSRRFTIAKAIEILNALRKASALPIMLIGAPKEKSFVEEVFNKLDRKDNIYNLAGTTNLSALIELLASASILLTTDSGPAHVANALGTHTVVLFGAGNENNTAPYNSNRTIIRLNKLGCEPCLKNACKLYEVPQCLQQLDSSFIISQVKKIHVNQFMDKTFFEQEVEEALEVLRSGGIILYPTDTIWGIGCDAMNKEAVKKIFSVKQREDSKSMIVLVSNERDIIRYVAAPDLHVFDFIQEQIRPTTIVFENGLGFPDNLLAADGSIAIRIVQDDFCRHLVKRLRSPIVSTSANISGEASPKNFTEISAKIKTAVDHVVKWRQDDMQSSLPSQVIKWKDGKPVFIRS